MQSSRPRRHSLGPDERRPLYSHQSEGLIMTGASCENTPTKRALSTAEIKKRGGQKKTRPDGVRQLSSGSSGSNRPSLTGSGARRRSAGARRSGSGEFSFSPYAPMMFDTGGSSSLSPRPRRASAPVTPAAAAAAAEAAAAVTAAAAKVAEAKAAQETGPTLEQCLVLPPGVELFEGLLPEPTMVVSPEGSGVSGGGDGGGAAGAAGRRGGGCDDDERAIISSYDYDVREAPCEETFALPEEREERIEAVAAEPSAALSEAHAVDLRWGDESEDAPGAPVEEPLHPGDDVGDSARSDTAGGMPNVPNGIPGHDLPARDDGTFRIREGTAAEEEEEEEGGTHACSDGETCGADVIGPTAVVVVAAAAAVVGELPAGTSCERDEPAAGVAGSQEGDDLEMNEEDITAAATAAAVAVANGGGELEDTPEEEPERENLDEETTTILLVDHDQPVDDSTRVVIGERADEVEPAAAAAALDPDAAETSGKESGSELDRSVVDAAREEPPPTPTAAADEVCCPNDGPDEPAGNTRPVEGTQTCEQSAILLSGVSLTGDGSTVAGDDDNRFAPREEELLQQREGGRHDGRAIEDATGAEEKEESDEGRRGEVGERGGPIAVPPLAVEETVEMGKAQRVLGKGTPGGGVGGGGGRFLSESEEEDGGSTTGSVSSIDTVAVDAAQLSTEEEDIADEMGKVPLVVTVCLPAGVIEVECDEAPTVSPPRSAVMDVVAQPPEGEGFRASETRPTADACGPTDIAGAPRAIEVEYRETSPPASSAPAAAVIDAAQPPGVVGVGKVVGASEEPATAVDARDPAGITGELLINESEGDETSPASSSPAAAVLDAAQSPGAADAKQVAGASKTPPMADMCRPAGIVVEPLIDEVEHDDTLAVSSLPFFVSGTAQLPNVEDVGEAFETPPTEDECVRAVIAGDALISESEHDKTSVLPFVRSGVVDTTQPSDVVDATEVVEASEPPPTADACDPARISGEPPVNKIGNVEASPASPPPVAEIDAAQPAVVVGAREVVRASEEAAAALDARDPASIAGVPLINEMEHDETSPPVSSTPAAAVIDAAQPPDVVGVRVVVGVSEEPATAVDARGPAGIAGEPLINEIKHDETSPLVSSCPEAAVVDAAQRSGVAGVRETVGTSEAPPTAGAHDPASIAGEPMVNEIEHDETSPASSAPAAAVVDAAQPPDVTEVIEASEVPPTADARGPAGTASEPLVNASGHHDTTPVFSSPTVTVEAPQPPDAGGVVEVSEEARSVDGEDELAAVAGQGQAHDGSIDGDEYPLDWEALAREVEAEWVLDESEQESDSADFDYHHAVAAPDGTHEVSAVFEKTPPEREIDVGPDVCEPDLKTDDRRNRTETDRKDDQHGSTAELPPSGVHGEVLATHRPAAGAHQAGARSPASATPRDCEGRDIEGRDSCDFREDSKEAGTDDRSEEGRVCTPLPVRPNEQALLPNDIGEEMPCTATAVETPDAALGLPGSSSTTATVDGGGVSGGGRPAAVPDVSRASPKREKRGGEEMSKVRPSCGPVGAEAPKEVEEGEGTKLDGVARGLERSCGCVLM